MTGTTVLVVEDEEPFVEAPTIVTIRGLGYQFEPPARA